MPNREVLDLDPNTYWAAPEPLPESVSYWRDLDPPYRGMLSSEQIRRYAQELQMIHPFNENQLKPASYELTLGPLYQLDGRDEVLTKSRPVLEIPPNSIVFVAMGERLVLPHYIVGRFDLQIDLIYRGLLLGTGPQVDPGFRGVLSCPLHNISDNPIRIRFGEQFAKIDFEKAGGWPEPALQFLDGRSVTTDRELYAQKDELRKFGVVLFNEDKRWKRPIIGYPAGEIKVASSLARLERTVTTFRNLGVAALVAVAIAVAGLIVASVNTVASATTAVADSSRLMNDAKVQSQQILGQIKDLSTEQQQLSRDLPTLQAQVDQLTQDRADLLQQLQQLQARISGTPPGGP